MTTFNEEIDQLQEQHADLLVEVQEVTQERDFWRSRAERALEALRLTLDKFESYESEMAELRRQLEYSQQLLDGAVQAMERLT